MKDLKTANDYLGKKYGWSICESDDPEYDYMTKISKDSKPSYWNGPLKEIVESVEEVHSEVDAVKEYGEYVWGLTKSNSEEKTRFVSLCQKCMDAPGTVYVSDQWEAIKELKKLGWSVHRSGSTRFMLCPNCTALKNS